MRNRQAFTLIELLVVISIIALLIAILLPALSKAREQGQFAQCKSNIRQQYLALNMYAIEHDDTYPQTHTRGGLMTWMPLSRDYNSQDENVYNCPSEDSEKYWVEEYGSGLPALYGWNQDEVRIDRDSFFTYGMNDWGLEEGTTLGMGNHIDGGPRAYTRRQDDIVQPSDFIALGDSTTDGNWDGALDPNDPDFTDSEAPSDRHFGGANLAYTDGHVAYDTRENLRDMTDAKQRRQWNYDNKPHWEIGVSCCY